MEKPHKKLRSWKLGMDIAIDVYQATTQFPPEERFGVVSQMRRASGSIPSNIAEGAARNSKKEFLNFLYICRGSLSELDTQLELSKRLDFVSEKTWKRLNDKLTEEDKILSGLIKSQKEVCQ